MAFNKSKALESALKSLNQGRVPDAIREYQQILRQDSRDQVTLMTLGDLFVRQGDMAQATQYFERLAQVYLGDGFNSKAIAIYKKIVKLAPNELDPLERLADLYVQQGVLSEARPLFLQIAEGHIKANHAPRAVEVLRRLLEVEPENLRVQMRLAELYNVMGQKSEAAKTYLNYAHRLLERGDFAEVVKLCDRALEVEPANASAITMKAQALGLNGNPGKAVELLRTLPDAEAGGETTKLLLDSLLQGDEYLEARATAQRVFAKGTEYFTFPHRVAAALLQAGHPSEAFILLKEIQNAMIDNGAEEQLLDGLTRVAHSLPGEIEPLETLVTFCRLTNNSFRLPDATSQLAQAYSDAGVYDRAETLLQELIERKPDDERLHARLKEVRALAAGGPVRAASAPTVEDQESAAASVVAVQGYPEAPHGEFDPPVQAEAPVEAAPRVEAALDEETQRYIAQALTDVDLFSSYGLTQKAVHLLDSVLEKAPRHTPALERLLDISLGASDERRTAQLAAQLERIHTERGDLTTAERYAELRLRFQKPGDAFEGIPETAARVAAPAPPAAVASAPPPEEERGGDFSVTLVEEGEELPEEPQDFIVAPPVEANAEPGTLPEPALIEVVASADEEIDLSDEWESLTQKAQEPAASPKVRAEVASDFISVDSAAAAPAPPEAETPAEKTRAAAEHAEDTLEVQEAASEPAEAEAPAVHAAEDLDLELVPQAPPAPASPMTADEFLSDIASEFGDEEHAPAAVSNRAAPPAPPAAREPVPAMASATPQPPADAEPVPASAAAAGNGKLDFNELDEVFQEFRSELGEISDEDEDLETHYNLGIAYREMGLLDEAIGEFQKVAKAVQRGKPFRYAMQCSTLLGLTFIDKGEPAIASLWYQRALEIPGLDQETVLALRYDLGVAQAMAGDAKSALTSFRQVYAMNIDYRDVAERIATLQKR